MFAASTHRSRRIAGGLCAAALWAAALGSEPGAQARPPQPTPRPAQRRPAVPASTRSAPGSDAREAVARRLCSQCHPFEFVIAVRHTRAQWEATVENMIGRGARGTNAEFATVIDYLSENHVLTPSTVRGGSGPDDKPMVDPLAYEAPTALWTPGCGACHGTH